MGTFSIFVINKVRWL
ncbi:erythromycin resistance leader peptide [Staphylococcus aureus]